jgi:hypothetical protein
MEASALRYVQLASAPCAVVRAVDGRILKRRPLHARSVAAQIGARRVHGDPGPREVPGEAWGCEEPLVEHVFAFGPSAGALSFVTTR